MKTLMCIVCRYDADYIVKGNSYCWRHAQDHIEIDDDDVGRVKEKKNNIKKAIE